MEYDSKTILDLNVSPTTLAGMIKRRANDSQAHWNKLYDLDSIRERNNKLYTTEYIKKWIIDERYQELFADNRMFVAVRQVLSFVNSRVAEPEVIPSDGKDLSLLFANDFEQVLFQEADDVNSLAKVKLAVQDLLSGQRVGILKWVYNTKKGKLELAYIEPKSTIIGKKSKLYDELDFLQEKQTKTVGDLIKMFPDMRSTIFQLFGIQKGVPSQLEREVDITENWMFVTDANGEDKLSVSWQYQNTNFGAMVDPCWDPSGQNMIDEPMMPYIFFNFLNDGKGYIDQTSLIEQAQYSQMNYDKRSMTIEENAAYAGTGVPVFASGSIKEETLSQVRFSPTQRILLDSDDVNKGFTTWNSGQLPAYVFEDKVDLRNNVDNIFGVNNLTNGQETNNPTAQQDIMLRDQAEGRQQELVDAVEVSMARFYQLEAQFIYRYVAGDTDKLYNFLGDDGQFESVMISNQKLRENFGIRINVKSGTSIPIDRAQRRAMVIALMKMDRFPTLAAYKELGVEKPDETYHQFLQEKLLPFSQLDSTSKSIESREAEQDLAIVIGGQVPEEREDIDDDYMEYLNEYLLTNKYHQLPADAQQRVSMFIADVIAQAQRKQLMLSTQQQIVKPQNSMPPIRPKISITGRDVQPDVLAQIVEASGYQPSALTPLEMAAGLVVPPQERMDMKTLNPAQQASQTGQKPAPAK